MPIGTTSVRRWRLSAIGIDSFTVEPMFASGVFLDKEDALKTVVLGGPDSVSLQRRNTPKQEYSASDHLRDDSTNS